MNHEPMCNTNIRCAVLHENGICPDKRKCDCKLSRPTPTPPTEKCCELCEWYESKGAESWAYCGIANCSCHTTDKGLDKLDLTIQELIEQVQEHGGARTSDIQGIKNVAQHIAKEEYKRGLGKGVYELKSLKGYIEQMEADGRVEIAWIKENIDGNIRNLEAALET